MTNTTDDLDLPGVDREHRILRRVKFLASTIPAAGQGDRDLKAALDRAVRGSGRAGWATSRRRAARADGGPDTAA